jgi:hypothetical protein
MGTLTKNLAAAAILVLGISKSATAGEDGLAGLHEQKREGDRICMSEHFHHGSSAGQATQKDAEAEAVRAWAGFVVFEYGEPWGDYAIAASKTMKCSASGTGWGCAIDARPCKGAKEQRKRASAVKSSANPPAKKD